MKSFDTQWLRDAEDRLHDWLGDVEIMRDAHGPGAPIDLLVSGDGFTLAVECKKASDAARVHEAIQHIQRVRGRRYTPVVAVPFMGDAGRELCRSANVSWFDFSGNANIVAPRLRILIDGKPNKFVQRGRPSSVFAPKSSRVVRRLLIDVPRPLRQQELAVETRLDDGFVSKICKRLRQDGYVAVEPDGALRVVSPDVLLEAWREAYRFDRHQVLRGHVSGRSGSEVIEQLRRVLGRHPIRHAFTGLAAANYYTKHAAFRNVTVFVAEVPSRDMLRDGGFHAEERGANVWLVVPDDDGVFDGARAVDGLALVHPVQTYVDLKAQPERSQEAAIELKERMLRWA